MILELPDTRQTNGWSCGEAAARVVFKYYEIKGRAPVASPIDGTDPRTLETSLWLAKLSVQAGSMDLDDLRYHTRRGRPVICLVTEGDTGHWVVVAGLERGRVRYQCPIDGPCVEPAAAFEARWQDVDRMGVRYVRWGISVG